MVPEKMKCPKCGYEQTGNAECIECGVIISKYDATQNKRREQARKKIHRTKSKQKKLKALGAALIIFFPVVFMVLFWCAFRTQEITSGEHLDAVDWLPPSATDISFTKRDGFGWMKVYTCSISEDDFFQLAAAEGWDLQQDGNVLFYEKWHLNGGGASVSFNTDSQRLSVSSSHR